MSNRGRYEFDFSEDGAFGHVVSLLKKNVGKGILFDLGAGYGPVAEPLRDFGYTYIAFDADEDSLLNLKGRGFDTHVIDLENIHETIETMDRVLNSNDLQAVLAIDVIEHLRNPIEVVMALSSYVKLKDAAIVVSIPNVAHSDLSVKLMGGRWDITETGLLDKTHYSLFNVSRLEKMMGEANLVEVDKYDVENASGDQCFPLDNPYVSRETQIGQFLRNVRDSGDPYGRIYQFVRCYKSDISKGIHSDEQEINGDSAQNYASGDVTAGSDVSFIILDDLVDMENGVNLIMKTVDSIIAQYDQPPPIEVLTSFVIPDNSKRFISTIHVESGRGSACFPDAIARTQGETVVVLKPGDELVEKGIEKLQTVQREYPFKIIRLVDKNEDRDDSFILEEFPLGQDEPFVLPKVAVTHLKSRISVSDEELHLYPLLLEVISFYGSLKLEIVRNALKTNSGMDAMDLFKMSEFTGREMYLMAPGILSGVSNLLANKRNLEFEVQTLSDQVMSLKAEIDTLKSDLSSCSDLNEEILNSKTMRYGRAIGTFLRKLHLIKRA